MRRLKLYKLYRSCYATVKPEQLQVVSGIISGQDVFAILPTGFGNYLLRCAAVQVSPVWRLRHLATSKAQHGRLALHGHNYAAAGGVGSTPE